MNDKDILNYLLQMMEGVPLRGTESVRQWEIVKAWLNNKIKEHGEDRESGNE